jgi:hypothetical protein
LRDHESIVWDLRPTRPEALVIKQIVGIGAGLAAVAVAGTIGYRHFMTKGPDAAAAAAPTPQSSRVINLGPEVEKPKTAESGKVLITPVTPKQTMPKASDLKPKQPTTQPAAQTPAAQPKSVAPVATQGQSKLTQPAKPADAKSPQATTQPAAKATTKPTTRPATQPTQLKAGAKKKVISLTGEAQSDASGVPSSKLTPQEKNALSLLHQMHSLRAAIDMWRARHGGQVPNFVVGPMWEQFTTRDEAGQVLRKAPVNPLNGQTRVLPVKLDPPAGEPVTGAFGYVYAVQSGRLFAIDAMGRVFDEKSVDAVALESKAVGELGAKDKERYLLTVLDAVRSQIATYARDHKGRPPEFAKYGAFEQLMKPTLADGSFAERSVSGDVFGPYILSMPVNPLNGRHAVAAVAGEVRPGQRIERSDAGFVFSAATNRFYATDAAGLVYDDEKVRSGFVPTEAGGTGRGSATTGAAAIGALRSVFQQYQAEHNGLAPDLKRYGKWEQLTGKTRADGKPDPAGPFGPYLFATPVNSRNNSSTVDVVGKLPKGYRSTKNAGYVFETATGSLFLTDEAGDVVRE